MRVLWVTNNIFPDLAEHLGGQIPVVGGWMYGLARSLTAKGVELVVATTDSTRAYQSRVNNIDYVLLKSATPKQIYDKSLEPQWRTLISEVKPNVIHIHGTEYAPGLALLNACPNEKYVVSIQGLVSIIARYYHGNMSFREIFFNITMRDILRRDTIFQATKKFQKRGSFEKKYLRLAQNVIGRTSWDRHHTMAIHPNRNYFFCNESLRTIFYKSPKWDINTKKSFSIFLSQAGYPLKGLHQVLKALPLIKEEFENIEIRVAGDAIVNRSSLKLNGYGKYLKSLIKKYDLSKNVTFLGPLKADQMLKEYLRSHIFICPSSIENSPNSLAEAQLLGVPSIAAYVGGVPDMVTHRTNGLLYRHEEIEMLSYSIKELFRNDDLAMKLSSNGIKIAEERHREETNVMRTLAIYEEIVS